MLKSNQAKSIPLMITISLMFVATSCGFFGSGKANLDRYREDLAFIAMEPRPPGSDHHRAVRNLCADRFAELGYEVEQQEVGDHVNVIGRLAGDGSAAESVLISAHYDSIPQCKGADDNASGVAGVLETARILAAESHDRTLVVACWDGEERGLLGSKAFATRERSKGSEIVVVYNYEMIGYRISQPNSQQLPEGFEQLFPEQTREIVESGYRGDFIALIYDDAAGVHAQNIARDARELGIPAILLAVDLSQPVSEQLKRSDHSPFWDLGYPAVMVTDTAEYRNENYHCPADREDNLETIDIEFATAVVDSVTSSARQALSPAD